MKENKLWYYGIEGIEFIWHGTNADAEVKYNGMIVNEPTLIDGIWDWYCDVCTDKGIKAKDGKPFEDFVRENAESVKGDIFDLWAASYEDNGMCLMEDEVVFYKPKYEDECDLIGIWKSTTNQGFEADEDDGVVDLYKDDENGKLISDCEAYAEDVFHKVCRGDRWEWYNEFTGEVLFDEDIAQIIREAKAKTEELYAD